MDQNDSLKPASEPLLAAWIKWTMDFWESLAQMGPRLAGAESPGAAALPASVSQSALKMWEAFFSLLSDPLTIEAVFKGIKAPSAAVLKMVQTGWSGYFHLHQQWLEGGQTAGSFGFETLDQDTFKAWTEIYEQDFKNLLGLAQLGLTRFPPDRLNRVMDRFGQYQTAMAEFMYMLYLPLKKSLRDLQHNLAEFALEGQLSEDFKDYYRMWLKVLEGHYMTLFKSPEYAGTLSATLGAMEDFTLAKRELLANALRALPVPTHRDMDELYREIYLLKKQVKELSRALAELKRSQGEPGD